jgi:hypothetical protein
MRALPWLCLPLLCVACGDPAKGPDPVAVLKALDAEVRVLEPELVFWWMETGLAPLRAAHEEIRHGRPSIRPLERAEVVRRAREAAVVLVADLHHLDLCRRGFARAVVDLTTGKARSTGHVGIAFEAVPMSMEAHVREARRREVSKHYDSLVEQLRALWPWPVLEIATLLRQQELTSCPLLGAGRLSKGRCPRQTPDAEREPAIDLAVGVTMEDIKYGADFQRANLHAIGRVTSWLREGEDRQAFVLYGAAHLLGVGNLAEGFRKEGFDVLVLVPFLPEWEESLRRRFGPRAATMWYEVLPGVLRAPYIREDEVLELAPRKPVEITLPR